MMYTRDAHNNDEAWMLEKLSAEEREEESFRSRDFLIAVEKKTRDRVAFGRLQLHRNVDDIEYVEISSVLILDRAKDEHGRLLLVDLAKQAQKSGHNRIFTFPNANHQVFEDVGFEEIPTDDMPQVMQERYEEKTEKLGEDTIPMAALPKSVEFELPEEDPFGKPEDEEVSEEEIEETKKDLGLDDNSTYKYSV